MATTQWLVELVPYAVAAREAGMTPEALRSAILRGRVPAVNVRVLNNYHRFVTMRDVEQYQTETMKSRRSNVKAS